MGGFLAFALGLLLGLVALLLGLAGLFATRAGSGRTGRPAAFTGALLGLVIAAAGMFASAPGRGLPPINDITTDLADPPAFADPARAYPGESFASQQRAAYADLAPIALAEPPDAAYRAALAAAQGLGWVVVREDAASGVFEATDTTAVFRFVDDVVVRVRPEPSGSRVDVRSKSRDGRGDVGANAARIRAFGAALAGKPAGSAALPRVRRVPGSPLRARAARGAGSRAASPRRRARR
jgi:uncharacterized protein (DUF1499 family)